MVLLPFLFLDAAAHINAIGFYPLDRALHVVRSKPSGKNNPAESLRLNRDVPVKRLARPAEGVRGIRVEQEGGYPVYRQGVQVTEIANPDRLDNTPGERAVLLRFISMELDN